MKLIDATPEKQCDNCASQEGRHYCLLHGQQVKNMDIVRCLSWKAKIETDEVEGHVYRGE